MQLPLSGPPGPGTPGPVFQGPPPNVMVQQGPMGGVLLPGPPTQPPHLHPGLPIHHPALGMGPLPPDHPGPRGPLFLNLESRIYELNRRLSERIESETNASLWWERFATEFFEDDATLTLVFNLDDGPKSYTIGRTLIPRYFRTTYEGGVTDLVYSIRSSTEIFLQANTIRLDCDRVTMTTNHNKPYYMQVQTEGRLICDFAYPLLPSHMPPPEDLLPRIRVWHFTIINYTELVPKNLLVNSDPAFIQDLSKNVTRQGLTASTLHYLRLCVILEPMQELMSHYRIYNNGQTALPPRECLNRVVFQKYNLLRGPAPPVQPMMPPEDQPKPPKRRKRKGSSSGGTTTPTGPGQGKKKPVPSPSPAMPSVGMPSSHVDVMVVHEPCMMGGEYGDEDERFITRLENTQYDPAAANAQMALGSPVTTGAPPIGSMVPNPMVSHLTGERPFDPSIGWAGSSHLHHASSVSSPNTPLARTTTPGNGSGLMHPQLVQSPATMPMGGVLMPGQMIRPLSNQNGSRQSTPNATPTSF